MQIVGMGQTANKSAIELYEVWKHLDEDDCAEQIEWHLESEGFTRNEIDVAMEKLGLFCGEFVWVVAPAA